MAELLVIADDLTGALDSGVQLARKGDHVLVCLDSEDGLSNAAQCDVLVIDSESRHDTPEAAYGKVSRLVSEGVEHGVRHVYKKTDSGLRGNVGAELAAVLDATGAGHLNFVPAYPKQHRTTERGIHYVAGTPLAQSIFSVDPVNPVTCSSVVDLVCQQTGGRVMQWTAGEPLSGVVVYDCASDEDMARIAASLEAEDSDAPMAGCAGLLEMLSPCSDGRVRTNVFMPESEQIVVVSGSVNAVTSTQLYEAERRGAHRVHLPVKRILAGEWGRQDAEDFVRLALDGGAESSVILFDTLGVQLSEEELADAGTAARISEAAGLCAALVSEMCDRTVVVVGGDALVAFVGEVGATLLEPIDELFPGIVAARYQGHNTSGAIITKSGAFGDASLFYAIYQALQERMGREQS